MKLCPTCQRHLRSPEPRCPFCGAEQRSLLPELGGPGQGPGLVATVLLGVMLAACGDRPQGSGSSESGGSDTGATGSGVSTTGSPTTGATTTTGTLPGTSSGGTTLPGATTDGTTNVDTAVDEGDEGCAFYAGCPPDVGPSPLECDPFAQDCAEGQKCAPWSSDGSGITNATKCVPVDGDKQPGEACTAMGPSSGLDDCVKGALCWEVGAQDMGHCVALCGGSPQDPTCGADETCVAFSDEALFLCASNCDPLAQGCPDEDVCVPDGDDFVCVVDASGPTGKANDACTFINACDPGLVCLTSADVSSACLDPSRCCTEFCEFPDGACPNPDQVCVQWFKGQDVEPGQQKIGFCGVMQ